MSRHADRTARLQYLVRQLALCGERPLMEAFLQVAAARPDELVSILESFCSIPPEVYAAIGADVLPIDRPRLIQGGRR